MARGSLHLLSLRKRLLQHKDFLKSVALATPQKRNTLLKAANPQQLRTLQLLLSSIVRGDLEISNLTYIKLKKSKKLPFLLQHFERANTPPKLPLTQLKSNILFVGSTLPPLINPLFKKKRK